MDLQKKIIVVTGGSGLIGRAIVSEIRSRGGTAVNADISASRDLQQDEYSFDIGDEASIFALRDAVVERYGRIDGWVNSVFPHTLDHRDPFAQMSAATWRRNIDLHLNGFAFCAQAALEQMKIQRSGSLVHIASIYGVVGPNRTLYEGMENVPNSVVYGVIKGGIIQMTRYLASLYGPHGVRVNAVSPGGIEDSKNQPKEFIERYSHRVPLGRMGTPEDIAPAVAFLLSDDARYITGHNLLVDGGWTAI